MALIGPGAHRSGTRKPSWSGCLVPRAAGVSHSTAGHASLGGASRHFQLVGRRGELGLLALSSAQRLVRLGVPLPRRVTQVNPGVLVELTHCFVPSHGRLPVRHAQNHL